MPAGGVDVNLSHHLKPKSFYGELNGMFGYDKSRISRTGYGWYYSRHKQVTHYSTWATGLEGIFGYTFQPITPFLVTPFIGSSWVHANRRNNASGVHTAINTVYAVGGVKMQYTFSPSFDLGLDLKAAHTCWVKARQNDRFGPTLYSHTSGFTEDWIYSAGVPLTYHFPAKTWDLRLTPNFSMTGEKPHTYSYGLAAEFGYNF